MCHLSYSHVQRVNPQAMTRTYVTYWECVFCALQGWAELYLFLFYDFYWQMEDLPKVKIASFVILSWFVSCLIFCLIICC